jgi:HK97 family phage major capsid protein
MHTIENKSRAAAELRAQADKIRADLLDASKTFTPDEVKARADDIAALEQRAAAAAGFTPEAEMIRQGSPELVTHQYANTAPVEMHDLAKEVRAAFGGPNGYLLAMARRAMHGLTDAQRAVSAKVEAFHQRTIIGDTGNASGGEFLLPLQQVASVFAVDNTVGGIYETALRFPVAGRTLRIPHAVQTNATGRDRPMAGIANVSIVGEAAEKPEREITFAQRLLTVYKWAAYTEVGDEVLADDFTGDLAPTMQSLIGGQVVNAINESVTIDGTGAAQPLGAFHANNTSRILVNRQTLNKFTVTDVFRMYSQHMVGPASRWYIHPNVLPEFMGLTLNGTTLVTQLTNLQGAPQMQVLGIPVVVTPLVSLLGTTGDVCLGNGAFYALAVRQALTVESSIHYKFRNDVTAYRFFARAGGLPIPDGTYSYKATAGTKAFPVSPFVVLNATVQA